MINREAFAIDISARQADDIVRAEGGRSLSQMTETKISQPTITAVSGLSSNTGKTTLMCDLLQRLPGWEAIKLTRGHYRSCGKDPQGCCVSDLIRDEPLIRTGREENYEAGKDTGRFWDAGAANVHWVIAGEDQVEDGIRQALSRVQSAGVLVEGNSFLDFVAADFAIVCARAGENRLKTSARRTLEKADAIYLSTIDGEDARTARSRFDDWRGGLSFDLNLNGSPILTQDDIPQLIERIQESAEGLCASSAVAASR
jgi:molybdopterin-guanine dinucleotide biosynthesis protein